MGRSWATNHLHDPEGLLSCHYEVTKGERSPSIARVVERIGVGRGAVIKRDGASFRPVSVAE